MLNLNYKIWNKKYIIANWVLKDMLLLVKAWRYLKGYPCNGQKTHTNSANAKKSKILLEFRLYQFYNLFKKRKRDIFPTLIQAEYNNRLWYYTWYYEWYQAKFFLKKLVNYKKNTIAFDPVKLSKGHTNGYVRIGNAAKIGKAKKILKQVTIGVPLFFTQYIYADQLPKIFPYRLLIIDVARKQMGKKKKKLC